MLFFGTRANFTGAVPKNFCSVNRALSNCLARAQQIDLLPTVWWLHSSVGRASHRHRRGHGFHLFADTAAILISIVSNSYYGMPRGQMHINLPPEHPIMSFETIEVKMAAVSAKRSIVSHKQNKLTCSQLCHRFIL